MKNTLIIILSAMSLLKSSFAEAQTPPNEIIALWPAGTAGIDPAAAEKTLADAPAMISSVYNPTLTVYRPSSPNGCAVVVCPGGGYAVLSSLNEGSRVAEWLTGQGITAFVLKYRLPAMADANFKDPVPLSDSLRAVQWVRSHAKDFHVDPARIGIMGFSAGGHLAASAGTLFSRASEFAKDAVAQTSARPDFMALIYAVITNEKDFRHGCLNTLLPRAASPEDLDAVSREKSVRADTPPAFIVHAKDDKVVLYQNSVLMDDALKKNGVASNIKLYERGGHGFGLGRKGDDSAQWTGEFMAWLKTGGFLGANPAKTNRS